MTGIPDDRLLGLALAGHYRLEARLGAGSHGVVYRARHELLGQAFAVKVLGHAVRGDPEVRARLLQEARTLSLLVHRNVAQVRHCGEEDGLLYVVTDLCDGESLDRLLAREGALSETRALGLVRQILGALAEAQRVGIVHRDLKPANVMVGADAGGADQVRVVDFGLARILGDTAQRLPGALDTEDGRILGTVAYMAPEQIRARKDVDARADLFSVGVMLYEMVAGHRPFESDSAVSVMMRIVEAQPLPLGDVATLPVSDRTARAVARALAKDADRRFPDASAFLAALPVGAPPPRVAHRGTGRAVSLTGAVLASAIVAAIGFGSAVPSANSVDPRRAEAASALAAGDGRAALALLGALARDGATTPVDHLLAARIGVAWEREEAISHLEAAARDPGLAADVLRTRARFLERVRQDPEAACVLFARRLVEHPRERATIESYADLALTRWEEGDARAVDDARALVDRLSSITDDPTSASRCRARLVRLEARSLPSAEREKALETALEHARRAAERSPIDARSAHELARVLTDRAFHARREGRWEEWRVLAGRAESALDQCLARARAHPEHGDAQGTCIVDLLRERAGLRAWRGDAAGAMKDARAAHASRPDLLTTQSLADRLRTAGAIREAIELYEVVLAARPGRDVLFLHAWCHLARGVHALRAGRHVEARADLLVAVSRLDGSLASHPDDAEMRLYRGEARLRLAMLEGARATDTLEAARRDIEGALVLRDGTRLRRDILFRQAELLVRQGEHEAAARAAEEAWSLRGDGGAPFALRVAEVSLARAAASALAEPASPEVAQCLAAVWTALRAAQRIEPGSPAAARLGAEAAVVGRLVAVPPEGAEPDGEVTRRLREAAGAEPYKDASQALLSRLAQPGPPTPGELALRAREIREGFP